MTLEASRAVADKLFAAHNSRTPIPPVREMLPADAIDLAYAAQEINTERRLKEGRRLVGRKIGLTSLAVQRQLGVDQPDYGMLFDDMAVPDGWDVARDAADPAQGRGRDRLRHRARPRRRASDHRRHFARGRVRAAGDRDRRFAHLPTGRSAFSTRSPTTPLPASMCWALRRRSSTASNCASAAW